jgi:hypothetical protein
MWRQLVEDLGHRVVAADLQRVPAGGQAGQERDRLRLVAAGVGGVVTPGFLVAEAGPGVETVHLMRPLR